MRIVLGIEYDGSGFYGWQAQADLPTIEGVLSSAIERVANESVTLFCAGRTDACVHAMGQVVHFDTHAKRHIDAWMWGVNAYLPPSIVVRWARHVDYHFHARFTAISRRYRYVIFNCPIRSAILNKRATWHYYPLDVALMREAQQWLIGEQDFSSFRSSKCNSRSPMRRVITVNIERRGDFVLLDIEANAFLHHMVRNIVGVLMKIGAGFSAPAWMQEVIAAKSRLAAAQTAPPDGLYLMQIRYQEPYHFPVSDEMILL